MGGRDALRSLGRRTDPSRATSRCSREGRRGGGRARAGDEEVEEVRKSFTDMGIDVQELFAALDEMEKAGSDAALGKEGKEFFQTLRKILA